MWGLEDQMWEESSMRASPPVFDRLSGTCSVHFLCLSGCPGIDAWWVCYVGPSAMGRGSVCVVSSPVLSPALIHLSCIPRIILPSSLCVLFTMVPVLGMPSLHPFSTDLPLQVPHHHCQEAFSPHTPSHSCSILRFLLTWHHISLQWWVCVHRSSKQRIFSSVGGGRGGQSMFISRAQVFSTQEVPNVEQLESWWYTGVGWPCDLLENRKKSKRTPDHHTSKMKIQVCQIK